jgi:hypothetical protein
MLTYADVDDSVAFNYGYSVFVLGYRAIYVSLVSIRQHKSHVSSFFFPPMISRCTKHAREHREGKPFSVWVFTFWASKELDF